MAVAMRESWTDERLDDFRGETARRFDEVERRFDRVDDRLDRFEDRFDRVDDQFDRVNDRFDTLHRAILFSNTAIFTAMLGFIATQL
jgi:predicted nuclease with TOPRIM domain